MSIRKTLKFLGTSLVGAAGLALAYAPQAQSLRDRLRAAFDGVTRRVREATGSAPVEETTAKTESTREVVRVEHAMEHGTEGRARALDQSRKPHFANTAHDASMHPSHARRHA